MAMEFSPLYMRRLSGSSTRNNFNEDALEQLEFNINDISRASSPASVTSTSARSEGHGSHHSGFSRDSRYRGSGRAGDEYRRKYNRMKHELELERGKARQLQQERMEEMRRLREAFESDQRLAMTSLQNKMEDDKKKEMTRLKEELIKQKDFELQQVLMYKESEKKSSRGSLTKADKLGEMEETQEKDAKFKVDEIDSNRREVIKDEEDDAARKDADNDIAKVNKRLRSREKTPSVDHKTANAPKTADSESEANADVFDGGGTTSMQSPKSKKSGTVHETHANKEGKVRTKSERKDNYVGRIVTKIERQDGAMGVDSGNGNNKSENMEGAMEQVIVKAKDESLQTSMVLKTDESQAEDTRQISDMESRIKELESQKSVLEKEASGVRRTLEIKMKEHKIKEEEFLQLRAGYDRELRTVINEHKKVALGNLDKLKMAEEALKQATLTDEEIASLSQRHERRRKLSTSSLPAMNNDETKKEDREREKNLQKKLGELTTQIQRLERRIALLRAENDTLRKKQDDHRPLEDKIKTLKKRNSELASIARRLEEKAKTLQQENSRVRSKSSSSLDDPHGEAEHVKRVYARQRAKELAEHAKLMLAKENEVDELRKKCQLLANKLGSGELLHPQNAPQFEEKEELVNIIKQAAKERLQLEQQLAHLKKREKGDGSEDPSVTQEAAASLATNEKQRQELLEANQILHTEIQKLEKALQKAEHLEQRISEKTSECSDLSEKLNQAQDHSRRLEKDLNTATAQNTQLTSEVKGLQQKVKDDEKITEECNSLKVGLTTAQKERQAAQEEVEHLNRRVRSLENLVRDLQESAEQVGQIEHERQTAIQQLQETKTQIGSLQKTLSQEESDHQGVVRSLNRRVEELEEKRRKEEDRREELSREVQRLKEEAEEKQRALEAAEELSREALERERERAVLVTESPIVASVEETALNQAVEVKDFGQHNFIINNNSRRQNNNAATTKSSTINNNNNNNKNNSSSKPFEDEELNELTLKLNSLVEAESDCSFAEGNLDEGPGSDRKRGMERRLGGSQSDAPVGESFLSSWAQNGPIQVYIAKYNYDPFEYSPNENPEAELPLSAGDYVLVVGEMDEDGFFDGELIDGRQGLVPSNFIEKVEDEDLAEFHAALMEAGHRDYSNNSSTATATPGHNRTAGSSEDSIITAAAAPPLNNTATPSSSHSNHHPHHPHINHNSNNNNNNNNNTSTSNNNLTSLDGDNRDKLDLRNGDEDIEDFNSDLEDIAEIDEDTASVNSRVLANGGSTNKLPPCPRGLSLDRQLSNSLLISWKEPELSPGLEVHSYHVLLDGQLKTSVKSSERTKALLECVDASDVHRVCVQCLSNRGQSKHAQCTMLVGKDVYPKPSDLKVSHQSPTSAVLSWLPGSSNYQHSIVLNGKEVRTVKPGTFRYTLTGLSPGTAHQVTLIAKSISGTLNEEKSKKWMENVSASIKFFTPEAGCPEAPLNVQVENGPRTGTVLLTWLPVTINASGLSNGNVVSGYHIMADGRHINTVSGATADHVVLNYDDFQGRIPSQLSVRTVCTSGVESSISDVVYLPPEQAKELSDHGDGAASHEAMDDHAPFTDNNNKPKSLKAGHDDPKGHDTDEEIEAAFREVQISPFGVNASIASEPYSDTSSSELSDIPEVEEDLVGSHDSNLNDLGKPLPNQVRKESPRPSPRTKGVNQNKTSPHEFHAPVDGTANRLAAPGTRVVPAIEITRDSGSDRGASLDEETDRESSPSRHNSKTQSPEGAIGNPHGSAFRQVDPRDPQGNHINNNNNSTVPDNQPHTASTPDSSGRQSGGAGAAAGGDNSNSRKRSNSNETPTHSRNSSAADQTTTATHNQKQSSSSAIVASPSSSGMEDVGGDNDSISGEINAVNENTVRLFIALFDYDPETMSPNVDSIEEELPFREGQILKVYGDKDPDGFYKGETHGRIGFVPCNMVSEVQIDDADLVEQLLKESMEMGPPKEAETSQTPTNEDAMLPLTPNGVPPMPREKSMRKMIALYDYDPQELSPNVDAELELSFKTGDLVYIFGDMDEDGFYSGEVNGTRGLVPSNFLQSAPHSDEDGGVESDSVASATRSRSGESIATSPKGDNAHRGRLTNQQQSSVTDSKGIVNNKSTSGSFSIEDSGSSLPSQPQDGDKMDAIATSSPTEDDKQPKKKTGFFSKSKNILKKLTR